MGPEVGSVLEDRDRTDSKEADASTSRQSARRQAASTKATSALGKGRQDQASVCGSARGSVCGSVAGSRVGSASRHSEGERSTVLSMALELERERREAAEQELTTLRKKLAACEFSIESAVRSTQR